MSIGRGGDINRYLDKESNAKFILGIDLFPVDEVFVKDIIKIIINIKQRQFLFKEILVKIL